MFVHRGERACACARARRGDRFGARPARLRRPGGGTGLPRRGAARPRPVRARRHARGGRGARRTAIDAGARICVHGDYDADGICATALAVLLLRELGADVAWHLPSRFEEGYGLNGQTLTRLAEEGFDLVLTVDCGITGVAEVEHARSLGLEIVVTDHHRPGDVVPRLPGRRAAEGRLSVHGPLRHGRRLEARPGAARRRPSVPRAPPRRGRAGHRGRRRAARRRESRARPQRAAPARADAEGRACRR